MKNLDYADGNVRWNTQPFFFLFIVGLAVVVVEAFVAHLYKIEGPMAVGLTVIPSILALAGLAMIHSKVNEVRKFWAKVGILIQLSCLLIFSTHFWGMW